MQLEWCLRPPDERGLTGVVEAHTVAMAELVDNTEPEETAQRTLSIMSNTTLMPELAMADVQNGRCRLLYSPLQLSAPRRRQTQIIMLEIESAMHLADYDEKFQKCKMKKEKVLDSIDERLVRINNIQISLDSGKRPPHSIDRSEDDIDKFLTIEDTEINIPKHLSQRDRCDV